MTTKIIGLIGNEGLSMTLFIENLKIEVQKKSKDYDFLMIKPEDLIEQLENKKPDMMLVSPLIGYQWSDINDISEKFDVPCSLIKMTEFGDMQQNKIIELIQKTLDNY